MSVKLSFESLGNDGLAEFVNRELARLHENIDDPNTEAKKARKLTIEVAFKPNDQRNFVAVTYAVKAALAPVKPVEITAMVDSDGLQIPEIGTHPDQHELPLNVTVMEVARG